MLNVVMNWILTEPVIIQGITEPGVATYVAKMKAYGTKIIAGVATRQQEQAIEEIPVFNLVEDITEQLGEVKTSIIFVPPNMVLDAAREAISSGLRHLIIATRGVPALDMIHLLQEIPEDVLILGSGSSGIVVPKKASLGTFQSEHFTSGSVGLISCSEFLTYEVAWELNNQGIGQSVVVDLGNEPILGSNLSQWLTFLDQDPETEVIVLIQQVKDIEKFAPYLMEAKISKPIVTYIAGLYTPQERVFQEATAIVTNYLTGSIRAQNNNKKILSLIKKSGVKVAETPSQVCKFIVNC
ncbi:MAG: CoA-binding protein [Xenococcaceae cyanobacterium MO_188.B19]|nr:CoA-binding protein [Xenococcaceae cyanobacterium MO_188.B19]